MSALGQKATCAPQKVMSALPPKADIRRQKSRQVLASVKLGYAQGEQGDADNQSNKPPSYLWVHDSSYLVAKWNADTRTIMLSTTKNRASNDPSPLSR
jgi:hypothetical protein